MKAEPVCFTSECGIGGYGAPVFQYNYTETPVGTCTDKLIPKHVTLSCIQTTDVRAKTDVIDSYKELYESGVAQQLTTTERAQNISIRKDNEEKSKQAGFSFIISFGMSQSSEYKKETHAEYMKYVKNEYASTMGGQPYDVRTKQTWTDWLQTVPDNPVALKFSAKPITNLISVKRFPLDRSQIANKQQLIQRALDRYTDSPVKCINDCTGSGECRSTGKLQFGLCECKPGFSGPDCSIHSLTPPPQGGGVTTTPSQLLI
ncbi:unnamed protein product [Didymodactylos carnosus]|uniref:EGF-like domain-containing protein n=1 Tax=Didymodactylos carnosus TaxID=1234261 RepID=A0A815VZU0_9BILA|nr:unnamed protein product [Didymodactylos carnosus]CAF1534530.1 unnamed protein product [Didymodactylos carnosus]CAF3735577.1 unnamed protein product [Didymodactylos carnosus]CAF4394188.1 unnamed protein product [Didymodactylos carnosus]